jgi:hypothetical protein
LNFNEDIQIVIHSKSARVKNESQERLVSAMLSNKEYTSKYFLEVPPKKYSKYAVKVLRDQFPGETSSVSRCLAIYGDRPKCHNCGGPVSARDTGWGDSCSKVCASKSQVRRSKIKEKLSKVDYVARFEKTKKTLEQKYGSVYNARKSIRENASKTCVDKYGVTCNLHSAKGIKGKKATWEVNHGGQNPMSSKIVINKVIKSSQISRHERLASYFEELSKIGIFPEFKTLGALNEEHLFRHQCGHLFKSKVAQYIKIKCPVCFGVGSSFEEQVLVSEFSKLGFDVKTHDRQIIKPYEIDLVVNGVGIEVNGIYWHSTGHKSVTPLIKKTLLAEQAGKRLLHFWDFEINDKTDIVLSMIKARTKSLSKIYARKCEVQRLDPAEARVFFDKSHLQGFCGAKIHLGLKYNNEIVQAISIGKSRFEECFEIIRSASSLNVVVVGGLSKLLSAAKEVGVSGKIVTYADRRFSTGDSYVKAGFIKEKDTKPGFFFNRGSKIINRRSTWGDKIYLYVPDFNGEVETREQALSRVGIYQCFDCGHFKFSRIL